MRRFSIGDTLKLLSLISFTCFFIYLTHSLTLQESALAAASNNRSVYVDQELFNDLVLHLRDTAYDGVDNYIRFMTATLGLKSLPDVDPILPGMGPVVNDVSWFRYPINIAPCAATGLRGSSHPRSLFVSVISAPHYFERRAMLRRTWPTHLKNQSNLRNPLDLVGFGFVIGLTNDSVVQQKVEKESEEFGDILQINMIDKYTNLSVKGAGVLNWVNTYCSQVDFILKVDDDVYVNVHNLATVLHSLTVTDRSVYGRQCGGNIPERKGSKWATSFEMWPWQRFPIYFQGAGVVITGRAVRPILAAIQVTPYFTWEDLYLIGLCAVKAKVQLRTSNQEWSLCRPFAARCFRIFVDMPANYADPCFVRSSAMWTTGSADVMNASHLASHHFYQSPPKAHCIDKVNNETNDEPANQIDFPFGTGQQN